MSSLQNRRQLQQSSYQKHFLCQIFILTLLIKRNWIIYRKILKYLTELLLVLYDLNKVHVVIQRSFSDYKKDI